MKLVILTIVLDGEPFIERHLPTFQQLTIPWQWIVVEGAAGNTADTAWCKPQEPRLSKDGTHEYLKSVADGKQVLHIRKRHWTNKTLMCNAALTEIKEPVVLMQIDADEIWNALQLEKIAWLFEQCPSVESMVFACNYFVGPDLMLRGGNCYGDYKYEWLRAWRFRPGMFWQSHEPPVLEGASGLRMRKNETRNLGLVFDHFPYATEAQAKYKEQFYGYEGLYQQWLRLQENDKFPVPLSRFFSHVSGDLPKVVRCQP